MKVLIFGAALAICMANQLPVSADYNNGFDPIYGGPGSIAWNRVTKGSMYGTPYNYGSGSATTYNYPELNISRTNFSNGRSMTTYNMPELNMSRTTYRGF